MDKKRPSTSRNSLPTYPCQAERLHKRLIDVCVGGGDPKDVDTFTRDGYLRDSFLSRYANPDKESSSARRQAAIDKMLLTEERNKETNRKLSEISLGFPKTPIHMVLNRAREFVAEIFGEFDYDVFTSGGFSNGSSTSRRRADGSPASKYDGKGDVTVAAAPYIMACIQESPLWARQVYNRWLKGGQRDPLRFVEGNVVFTVPKSNDIDRAAAKEPDYNMFLQKAVGKHIRRRLKTFGVNLNDQRRNQELARIGSIDGTLATLDLSSASDSVTIELVRLLVPDQWFHVMCDLRSERGIFPSETKDYFHVWEMFSSMGNGFTFELESCLFYALTRAVTWYHGIRGTVNVYGDDIICPTEAVPHVIEVLGYTGFLVNESKSFWTGPFRESCGKHWLSGVDVTPFYARKPINDESRSMWFCNKLREWSAVGDICDPRFYDLWKVGATNVRAGLKGGRDLTCVRSLVTPDRPRNIISFGFRQVVDGTIPGLLVALSRSKSENSDLPYESDSSDPYALIGMTLESTPGSIRSTAAVTRIRLRPNRSCATIDVPIFPQEIGVIVAHV